MCEAESLDALSSPSDRTSLRRLLVATGILLLIPLLLDQVLIRTMYMRFIEPESTAGMAALAKAVVNTDYDRSMKNVLVIGDSRIGEGFSLSDANEIGHRKGVNFVRLGLPGTTPRVWYYVLRDIDPVGDKFAAVYLMAETYRDEDVRHDYSNRVLDTAYLVPLLGWRDFLGYPASFGDPSAVKRAQLAIAFPESALQADILAFIKAPRKRIRKAILWGDDYPNWLHDYKGRVEELPMLSGPINEQTVVESVVPERREELRGYFRLLQDKPAVALAEAFSYRSKWFGAISSRYQHGATRVSTFLIPRGPYHAALGKTTVPQGALVGLRDKNMIELVDPSLATRFEYPQYFFDHLHMNARGRVAFTRDFAMTVVSSIAGDGQ